MEPIIIDFPQFPEDLKLSEHQRAKYFIKGKYVDKYPQKYFLNGSPVQGYSWKKKGSKMMLWDNEKGEFVLSNPFAAGTPKYISVAGNEIMRMHEHDWKKIIILLKDYFLEGIGTPIGLDDNGKKIYESGYNIPVFPINVSMEIHTFPRYQNWDLDNLWIYNKCFQDAMKECGMIPDDNIQYITGAAAPKFIPVTREADRLMRFTISQETDSRILSHIMYSLWRKVDKPVRIDSPFWKGYHFDDLLVSTDYHTGKPGDIMVEGKGMTGHLCWINTGLKKNLQIPKALERIRHQCFQMNCIPTFTEEDYKRMRPDITSIFMSRGIPVKVI